MKGKFKVTDKGLALISAIEAGLLPEKDNGWDDAKFNEFWDKYKSYLHESKKKKKDPMPIILLITSIAAFLLSVASLIIRFIG